MLVIHFDIIVHNYRPFPTLPQGTTAEPALSCTQKEVVKVRLRQLLHKLKTCQPRESLIMEHPGQGRRGPSNDTNDPSRFYFFYIHFWFANAQDITVLQFYNFIILSFYAYHHYHMILSNKLKSSNITFNIVVSIPFDFQVCDPKF